MRARRVVSGGWGFAEADVEHVENEARDVDRSCKCSVNVVACVHSWSITAGTESALCEDAAREEVDENDCDSDEKDDRQDDDETEEEDGDEVDTEAVHGSAATHEDADDKDPHDIDFAGDVQHVQQLCEN
jgi:hypothetical protein